MKSPRSERFDVAVIGAGMAGMAAALFAARSGLSCIQVGNGGGLLFASGLLDLLGVHPVAQRRLWQSPYLALAALSRAEPQHPLARVDAASVRAAFESFVGAVGAAGLAYAPLGELNRKLLTSLGSVKTSYAVPQSMLAGAKALQARPPCLLVDFRGLREFSAAQIVATLGAHWPKLRHERIEFPGAAAAPELYAAHLARALENAATRERTIALVRPLLGDARAVGFPAVLGIAHAGAVHAAFEAGLGVPVFEIPSMPTSVPGLRLLRALESAVVARGVQRRHQARVRAIAFAADEATLDFELGAQSERVSARAVVLATGRFAGRGLRAERDGVREPILGLPVDQPASRALWHEADLFDPAGHAVNRAGLLVDEGWRPLDAQGRPAWRRLYAVGSILAHQDWMRSKCGSGLAIATAWAAIGQAQRDLGTAA